MMKLLMMIVIVILMMLLIVCQFFSTRWLCRNIIMEDKIILLIIKVFLKIVAIIEIIMKKFIKKQQASINYNNGNSLNEW